MMNQDAGRGKKSFDDVSLMDRPQKFSSHPNAFDAVFFSGANDKGEYFVVATERKPKSRINAICYIMVREVQTNRGNTFP